MIRNKNLLLAVFSMNLLLGACTPSQSQRSSTASNTSSKGDYNEDLSTVRPRYGGSKEEVVKEQGTNVKAVTPSNDITKGLNSKIDSIAVKNKKIKIAEGFRIMVYTGSSSEEVRKIKDQVRLLLPGEPVYDQYRQPTFRVKVGDCFNRIEANNLLVSLQKDFPNAIIVPDQINIHKE
ncbi:MAG TPA: SPOR domain-containing protein [Cytophagaceae bacterium]|jgi:hypothetical protein